MAEPAHMPAGAAWGALETHGRRESSLWSTEVLPAHGILAFEAKLGATIVCVAGELWVTGPGTGDQVLTPGQSINVHEPGRIVVEALGASLLRIDRRAQRVASYLFRGKP